MTGDTSAVEWVVQGWYSRQYGWEDLTAHDTKPEALSTLQDYDTNEPQYRHRVRPRRTETT